MENQRPFFLIVIVLFAVLLYFAWDQQQRAGIDGVVHETVEEDMELPDRPGEPVEPVEPAAPAFADDERPTEPVAVDEVRDAEIPRVLVRTDLMEVEISARGGEIRRVDLLQHRQDVGDPTPFRLMQDDGEPFFVAQGGLQSREGPAPDHRTVYRIERDAYELREGMEYVEVPFQWNDEGVEFRKVFRFHRDSYLVDVRHEVLNRSDGSWRGYQYIQLRRAPDPPGMSPWYIHTYSGGVIYSPEDRYEKISFSDMAGAALSRDIRDGWAAMIQHYFLGAIIPPRGEPYRYFTRSLPGEHYILGMSSGWGTVAAGDEGVFTNQLFIGPKEQDRLTVVDAEGLRLTVDYGFLTIIANPLFWLLDKIHDFVGNWGWSIIILTLLIKLAFYKLSAMSYRSMANMRRVQPRMQQIRERYSDDRQRMNQALMELYKKEKINPLGGCLPILVQIPVFIALYWVLLESVELRHAPFILWLNDLSSRDPFFVLPVLMGLTMFLQMRLNPAPMDPIQQRIMQVLPIVFTGFFMLFPSGLVLYWLSNNVLSIAQQWVIMRSVEKQQNA